MFLLYLCVCVYCNLLGQMHSMFVFLYISNVVCVFVSSVWGCWEGVVILISYIMYVIYKTMFALLEFVFVVTYCSYRCVCLCKILLVDKQSLVCCGEFYPPYIYFVSQKTRFFGQDYTT